MSQQPTAKTDVDNYRAFFDLHTIKAALWPWNILGAANLGLEEKNLLSKVNISGQLSRQLVSEMSAKRARNQLFSREYCTKLKYIHSSLALTENSVKVKICCFVQFKSDL